MFTIMQSTRFPWSLSATPAEYPKPSRSLDWTPVTVSAEGIPESFPARAVVLRLQAREIPTAQILRLREIPRA